MEELLAERLFWGTKMVLMAFADKPFGTGIFITNVAPFKLPAAIIIILPNNSVHPNKMSITLNYN